VVLVGCGQLGDAIRRQTGPTIRDFDHDPVSRRNDLYIGGAAGVHESVGGDLAHRDRRSARPVAIDTGNN
jgi:hypothetical protein